MVEKRKEIKMKSLIISIAIVMLIASGVMQAGFLKTVAEIPARAVEASTTVVEDVVIAPSEVVKDAVTASGELVKDVLTVPAKVLAPETVKTEEVVTPKNEEAVQQAVEPVKEMPAPIAEVQGEEPVTSDITEEEVDVLTEPSEEIAE